MGLEANLNSIRALEGRIESGDGDVIKLKRVRNSLLNISTRVPPEILGHIFIWSVFRKEDHSLQTRSHFERPRRGSYNFRLVCHHWSEVASNTPELWSFWGNSVWWWWWNQRRHPRIVPRIDLVLTGPRTAPLLYYQPLWDVLRDRATQDAIRQVHLRANDDVLSFFLSSLTPSENVRRNSIESIDLQTYGGRNTVDVSNFFARHHLPKLRSLFLHGFLKLPSWGRLVQQTTLLTTLSINIVDFSPSLPPTTPQLLSILASNPNLRELSMSGLAIPEDDGDVSTPRVSLPHLEKLHLAGELRRVFGLLDRLVLPDSLERMELAVFESRGEDLSRILGPYLQKFLRHDHDRLEIKAYTKPDDLLCDCLSISVVTVGQLHSLPPSRQFIFEAVLEGVGPTEALENLCLDIVASIPRERVVSLSTNFPSERAEDLLAAMPNIETIDVPLDMYTNPWV